MAITRFENENAILKQIGERIKQHRISLNITQEQFAQRCGIATTTLIRIENGSDSKFSNYIKIMIELGLVENLNLLIPEKVNYKAMFENTKTRKKARTKTIKEEPQWVWGEDE